ncbi:MAG TPA: hypothetical protein P5277_00605 [Candidatus Paceibacterota bacterium]|nr:hypothetical protein [Candidatus Paceibacterota bacterium]
MGYSDHFYMGSSYGLNSSEPKYGYRLRTGNISISTDARTANQLGEISQKLNQGVKNIEMSALAMQGMGGDFNKIPQQHLEELRRVSKLVGANISVHGPLIEPSGVNLRSQQWNESERQYAEREIKEVLMRTHEINPEGNIVVTFHSSAALPEMLQKEKEGKEERTKSLVVINENRGVTEIKDQERFFPRETEQGVYKFDPKKELEELNNKNWVESIDAFAYHADIAKDRIIRSRELSEISEETRQAISEGTLDPEKLKRENPYDYQVLIGGGKSNEGLLMLKRSYEDLKGLYEMAYKSAKDQNNQEQLKKLNDFGNFVKENLYKLKESDPIVLNSIISKGVNVLSEIKDVQIFKPLNEFAIDKSSETFSNAAFDVYNKFKDNSPIISIENPPANQGISRAEDLKKLIEESRNKLAKKLISEKGISDDEASKIAEKMIGATWDVGHINMIRKFGYGEQDVVKESKKIAPFVKHVHLSDNFGMEHSELPMGMGNVPMKKIMEELGEKGEKAAKVIEAFDWWSNFKTSPLVESLQAFSSPVYAMKMEPYWNSSMNYGNYFSGYGEMLPDRYFSDMGSGFSNLPSELGGRMQTSGKSRMSGTPMA